MGSFRDHIYNFMERRSEDFLCKCATEKWHRKLTVDVNNTLDELMAKASDDLQELLLAYEDAINLRTAYTYEYIYKNAFFDCINLYKFIKKI